ncbi:MAG: polyphosphate polymerase domain-containing protein [Treponema sp.]|nr:polyphosphate polymerase domain-containing protein [Treponema sp.]
MAGSGQLALVKRYEKKYRIRPELVPEIRKYITPFVIPDKFGIGDPPEYMITTLQLDTPSYAFHYAKELEYDERFKLRVRTYNEPGTSPVFAEVKSKIQDIIVKSRVMVPFDKWGPDLIFSTDLPYIFKSTQQETDFLKFRRLVWETDASPANILRYTRESYVGPGELYLRVTFDRKLEYCPRPTWTNFGRGETWYSMDSGEAQDEETSCVVLEIKTLEEVPAWIIDMVEKFNLQNRGNCKYSTGMWKDSLFSRKVTPRNSIMESLVWSV